MWICLKKRVLSTLFCVQVLTDARTCLSHNSRGRVAMLYTHKTKAIMPCCQSLDSRPRMAVAAARSSSDSRSTKQTLGQFCCSDALHLPSAVWLKCSLRRKFRCKTWHATRENSEKKTLHRSFTWIRRAAEQGMRGLTAPGPDGLKVTSLFSPLASLIKHSFHTSHRQLTQA